MKQVQYYAAIDLGSNSFHMIVAQEQGGVLTVIDRVKDMVQVARGLKPNGELADDAQIRALECLACFRERLAEFPASSVRAVGTKALRSADNSGFLREAQVALGHPIEIISGYEEARLVYQGVSHAIPQQQGQTLVIDIGGGSTEFIIGHQTTPLLLESLNLGCVTFSQQFFKADSNAATMATAMNDAYMAACTELEIIAENYRHCGWDVCFGASGTIKAIAAYLSQNDATIERDSLQQLYADIVEHGVKDSSDIAKLRKQVLPAGVAILRAIFEQLDIQSMHVADTALKEGLIFDSVGRMGDKDIRDETIHKLAQRYAVDPEQGLRVSHLASKLLSQLPLVEEDHKLIRPAKLLHWAAQVHEIGISIAHVNYHLHGHYILRHSDMAGFSRIEQHWLAQLVKLHRKKLPNKLADNLPKNLASYLLCLRLAILLCRNRKTSPLTIELQAEPSLNSETLAFILSIDNLENHPLTHKNLCVEIEQLKTVGVFISIAESR